MRKVIAVVKTRVEVNLADRGVLDRVLENMDYKFEFEGEDGSIFDTEIIEWYEEVSPN